LATALKGGDGSASRPGRSLPPGKTRFSLYRKLGGLQGRSGQVRKISPPPGFDSRTVQPVASRYTDCATRPTYSKDILTYIFNSVGICAERKTTLLTRSSFSGRIPWSTPVMRHLIISLREFSFLLRYMRHPETRSYYSPLPIPPPPLPSRKYPVAMTESVLLLPVHQHEALQNILHISTQVFFFSQCSRILSSFSTAMVAS